MAHLAACWRSMCLVSLITPANSEPSLHQDENSTASASININQPWSCYPLRNENKEWTHPLHQTVLPHPALTQSSNSHQNPYLIIQAKLVTNFMYTKKFLNPIHPSINHPIPNRTAPHASPSSSLSTRHPRTNLPSNRNPQIPPQNDLRPSSRRRPSSCRLPRSSRPRRLAPVPRRRRRPRQGLLQGRLRAQDEQARGDVDSLAQVRRLSLPTHHRRLVM